MQSKSNGFDSPHTETLHCIQGHLVLVQGKILKVQQQQFLRWWSPRHGRLWRRRRRRRWWWWRSGVGGYVFCRKYKKKEYENKKYENNDGSRAMGFRRVKGTERRFGHQACKQLILIPENSGTHTSYVNYVKFKIHVGVCSTPQI